MPAVLKMKRARCATHSLPCLPLSFVAFKFGWDRSGGFFPSRIVSVFRFSRPAAPLWRRQIAEDHLRAAVSRRALVNPPDALDHRVDFVEGQLAELGLDEAHVERR